MSVINPTLVTTAFDLPGYRTVQTLGVVRGIVVRSRSIVGNIGAAIQTLVGGNITLYTELCERARADAFHLMLTHAAELGANALVGMRYDANEVAAGVTEVLAYGTAVRVEQTDYGVSRRSARKPGMAWRCLLTCWLMALAIVAAAQSKTVPILDVIHYDARVEPDIASKTVKGEVVLTFLITASGRTTIELDRGDLTIDSVREGGQAREFVQQGRKLTILLARPSEAREQRRLAIEYHGAPMFGLQFFPERSQITTVFSTSQWLVCVDDPSDRATLKLSVVLPANLTAAGSGRLVGRRALPGEKTLYEWELDRQVPTYTLGLQRAASSRPPTPASAHVCAIWRPASQRPSCDAFLPTRRIRSAFSRIGLESHFRTPLTLRCWLRTVPARR